jgi:hypothetical protein
MRKDLSPHVSSLLEKFVPEHIRSNYPQFIDFIRAYFDYLEESNESAYYQNTLPQQRDIRTQEQEFLALIQKEIGLFVPSEYAADPKIFYDRISDLWRSKGSQEAIETFFRLFLDDVVEIEYPWNRVLIPSDGRWIVEDKLRVSMISGDANDFAGKVVQQVGSDAQARVDRVERRVYSDGVIFELTLVKGTQIAEFDPRARIVSTDGLEAEIYKSVSGLSITSVGTNYQRGDRIRVKGFEGFTFTAFVSGIDENGGITDVRFSNYGAGNTPNHVKASNTSELYYFEDFLLYRYSDDTQVGPSVVEYEIDTDSGSGADFDLRFDAVVTTPGEYRGVRGQLDESIVLQDSDFYQKFSYEVSTSYSTRRWIDALKRTVHPGGMAVFGNVRINETLDNTVASSVIYTAITEPPKYVLLERPRFVSNPLGFAQDYTIPEQVYFAEAYVGEEFFNQELEVTTETSTESFTNDVFVTQD